MLQSDYKCKKPTNIVSSLSGSQIELVNESEDLSYYLSEAANEVQQCTMSRCDWGGESVMNDYNCWLGSGTAPITWLAVWASNTSAIRKSAIGKSTYCGVWGEDRAAYELIRHGTSTQSGTEYLFTHKLQTFTEY